MIGQHWSFVLSFGILLFLLWCVLVKDQNEEKGGEKTSKRNYNCVLVEEDDGVSRGREVGGMVGLFSCVFSVSEREDKRKRRCLRVL